MGDSKRTPKDAKKTWTKTRIPNLVRHKNGGYYARIFEGGKERWESLKTDRISIAEGKLKQLLDPIKEARKRNKLAAKGKIMMGAALDGHLADVERRDRKPATMRYWNQTAAFLRKTWPGFDEIEARDLTTEDCQEWALRAFRATESSNRYNNAVGLLKNACTFAVERGGATVNVAVDLERKRVTGKQLELPSKKQFLKLISEMRSTPNERGGADLAEGLAYTGMRLGEAHLLTWDRVNLQGGEIHILAERDGTGTKSGISRRVPLSSAALEFFAKLKTESGGSGRVFSVDSCIKSLQRACKEIGIKPLTHHDLRHYFATICIESGVDIPTVSRWLGHQDGGALAMRVYGHLRDEHSRAAAKKVEF